MTTSAFPDNHQPAQIALMPPARRERTTGQLPALLTQFVGREQESAAAVSLLRDQGVRLLTFTGPGGAGKTRLALHVAAEVSRDFTDGAAFVPLAAVIDPGLVVSMIARACELREAGGQPVDEMLAAHMRDRHQLLVLDNFEQVVEAAPQLTALLIACPNLSMLVTSQVALRVQGEQEMPVPPMELPPRKDGETWHSPPPETLLQYDAVALFTQRARSVQPTFTLTGDNALAITEICRRLDGLPLAIELAAARIKVLSPSALLSRLAEPLATLTSGSRDLPPRLQTMRAAIAWSYDLLSPEEQQLFRRLAVFSGGFMLDAASAVADQGDLEVDVFDGVSSLVDKSLLRLAGEAAGEPRFAMLQTIREYGLERLAEAGELDSTRQRQARWCVAYTEEGEIGLQGPAVLEWLDRFEAEHDNIREILGWTLDHGEIDITLRIAVSTWLFWFQHSYFLIARRWLEQSLAQAGSDRSPLVAEAITLSSVFAQATGDFELAVERAESALALATSLGDPRALALATFVLADNLDTLQQYEPAEKLYLEAAPLLRAIDFHGWLSVCLVYLAQLAHRRGDDVLADQRLSEALSLSREAGFVWGMAMSFLCMGRIASDRQEYAQAYALHEESLALLLQLGDRWRVARIMIDLADVVAATGEPERAIHLLGASDAINEPLLASPAFTDNAIRRRAMERVRTVLSGEEIEAAWRAGRAMSWDEAIAEATAPLLSADAGSEAPLKPQPEPVHNLTSRELEVLQLLVAGQSDREIAEALFISPRTVQSHVANIFTKLGVNSRTAAATAALRAGLVAEDSVSTTVEMPSSSG